MVRYSRVKRVLVLVHLVRRHPVHLLDHNAVIVSNNTRLCRLYPHNITGAVVVVELVEAAREGRQHQEEYEEELPNVYQHTPERNLQGTQLRVRLEQVNDTSEGEDVRNGEDSF